MCFTELDVSERDSLRVIFNCECTNAQLCSGCTGRLSCCPWCRAPKRSVSLQIVVQRQSLSVAVVVRRQFYAAVRQLHACIAQGDCTQALTFLTQCWQFVRQAPGVFVNKEVYCLEDSSKALDALLHGHPAPPTSCCIFERVLRKMYEYRLEPVTVAQPCTSCRFVHKLYGNAYVALSCTLCA